MNFFRTKDAFPLSQPERVGYEGGAPRGRVVSSSPPGVPLEKGVGQAVHIPSPLHQTPYFSFRQQLFFVLFFSLFF